MIILFIKKADFMRNSVQQIGNSQAKLPSYLMLKIFKVINKYN